MKLPDTKKARDAIADVGNPWKTLVYGVHHSNDTVPETNKRGLITFGKFRWSAGHGRNSCKTTAFFHAKHSH
jgi:hypothetical protein